MSYTTSGGSPLMVLYALKTLGQYISGILPTWGRSWRDRQFRSFGSCHLRREVQRPGALTWEGSARRECFFRGVSMIGLLLNVGSWHNASKLRPW